jgi:hypothetical protein
MVDQLLYRFAPEVARWSRGLAFLSRLLPSKPAKIAPLALRSWQEMPIIG